MFKPVNGEKMVAEEGTGYKRERAAYLANIFLELDLVPPTIIRSVEGEDGSLQQFISDSTVGYNLTEQQQSDEYIIQQKNIMHLFDYIVGNTDRHEGNFLVDKNRKVWAIDHGYAFNSNFYGFNFSDLHFPIALSSEFISKIKKFDRSDTRKKLFTTLLAELIDLKQIQQCLDRVRFLAHAFNGNQLSENAINALNEKL